MAETPEALSALTVQAQLNWGMQLSFFDFTQLKNGQWACWYKIPYLAYVEKVGHGAAETE